MTEDQDRFSIHLARYTGDIRGFSLSRGMMTREDVRNVLPAMIEEVFGLTITIQEETDTETDPTR